MVAKPTKKPLSRTVPIQRSTRKIATPTTTTSSAPASSPIPTGQSLAMKLMPISILMGANATHKTVGAGLLAKADCQTTQMLNVRPLSRAGSLPQGGVKVTCQDAPLAGLLPRPGAFPAPAAFAGQS